MAGLAPMLLNSAASQSWGVFTAATSFKSASKFDVCRLARHFPEIDDKWGTIAIVDSA